MSKHYTAVLEVNVTEVATTTTGRSYEAKTETTRDVREVAKLVIRADSLATLSGKLVGHIGLIEED